MPARYCGHRSGDCAISSRVVLSSAAARPDGVALALDEVDRLADAREIARPGRRQLEAAVEAAEQRRAQLALEVADAPAHRRGREMHGLRGFGEAERPAGR